MAQVSNAQKRSLDALVQQPRFGLVRSGDTLWAEAPGEKRVRLSLRGNLTAPGRYLAEERGVVLPRRDLRPQETYFRGNSEYGRLSSGQEVKLRDARGVLTARGKQYYDREEVLVLAPAVQVGTNRSTGEEFRIPTQKVLTEVEFPQLGDVFRRAGGSAEQRSARVVEYLKNQLGEDHLFGEERPGVAL